MNLSNRQKEIINILATNDNFISAKILAQQLEISEKTIYREIKKLENISNSLIEKSPSKGYLINKNNLFKINSFFNKPVIGDLSVATRQRNILLNLLLESPKTTSINKLSKQYLVSATSIVADLKSIEYILNQNNLELIKSSSGTFINGSERAIRNLIVVLMEDVQNTENFNKKDYKFIKSIIEILESKLDWEFIEPYKTNIFFHLLITIKRYKYNTSAKLENTFSIENDINLKVWDISKFIVITMSEHLGFEIPSIEEYYIYQHIISSRATATSLETITDNNLMSLVDEVIEEMSLRMSVDFKNKKDFKDTLILHFEPMLKRFKYGISIQNSLLSNIKKDFSLVFTNLKSTMTKLSKKYNAIKYSEDEVGFLTLYFQAAIESIIEERSIIIVCSTGVGTSHLLKSRVKKYFPNLNIKNILSVSQVKNYDLTDIDLILTTVNLPQLSCKQILVGCLLQEYDIKNIKNFISNETRRNVYGYN